MMELAGPVLAVVGTGVLAWRLCRTKWVPPSSSMATAKRPLISIIVPARNEEKNLPSLLNSLSRLTYPNYEVILVNDQSTDQTEKIARAYPFRVLQGEPLPDGWNGKNWACHQAAQIASGEYFLFTDADTVHERSTLERALEFYQATDSDLISGFPFHENPTVWEKWMGPFHALLCVATNYLHPKPRRLFAIGQFLFLSKMFYQKCGGHAAVRAQYPDDLALANLCYEKGGRYDVYTGPPLYRVRMYLGIKEFIQGWRRNFLAGIQQSRLSAFFEVCLVFFAFGFIWTAPICLGLIAFHQRKWGRFSLWGPVFFPFSLLFYCGITVLALYDFITGNNLNWKGRRYASWKR